ncbi:hypothetical protein PMAYCL1PPCAC_03081, partial [Pristionchus mayeri]
SEMARFVLFSVLLLGSASAFISVPFKDCKSVATIEKLEMSECTLRDEVIKDETKQVCIFAVGSKPTIKITFKSTEAGVDNLETTIKAKFGQSTLPYQMSDYETCKHGGLACPLEQGKSYTYQQSFTLDPSYPKDTLFQANWQLASGGKKHVCVVFLARIE